MLLLEIPDIKKLIETIGLKNLFIALEKKLIEDFSAWHDFQKSPRHAVFADNGVIELMPVANKHRYSFKYVNGHPNNPLHHRLNIVAFGMLADMASGYPLMISEMTLLTAIRTAATAALASKVMAKKGAKKLAIIGCGAQSEFQVLAHHALLDLTEIRYFDIDPHAMERFARNLHAMDTTLTPAKNVRDAIQDVDIIITATAAKKKQHVLEYAWLTPGQHIAGIGGDSPGKTELDPEILKHGNVVVEYFPQTFHEGEIQNLGTEAEARSHVYAELWEILSGKKPGRANDQDLSIYDSVGFALEDFSILSLVYEMAQENHIGKNMALIPDHIEDCKDLYGLLIH